MIETLDNGIQLTVLLACAGVALWRAAGSRSRTWTLLALFMGSWALGDAYWLVCLVFYGATPEISLVSDLSWYAALTFLYLLLRQAAPPEGREGRRLTPWLGPAFAAGAALYFMQWGDVFSNLVYAALMGLALFAAIARMEYGDPRMRPLGTVALAFCLSEYGLWFISVYWAGDTLGNPYFWVDGLQTLILPLFLPATRRARMP